MTWYAGVGSRETPKEILDLMTKIAMGIEKGGYKLRSGGAVEADSALEQGIQNAENKRIYLPNKGFNGNNSKYYGKPTEKALEWASRAHPYFANMKSELARNAHARNAHQVLGDNLDDPVKMVICWTPDGAEHEKECHSTEVTGGTRTAIVIASMNNIPVFNLARPGCINSFKSIC